MLAWDALAGQSSDAMAGALQKALHYLGSRARARTPLGAAEYLTASVTHGRDTYEKRVRVALEVTGLYRELFPEEYEASAAPPFSTQREHEFYRLVESRLFPLLLSESVDLETHLRREPNFFLPFIPMRGTQKHIWMGGCFHFQEIGSAHKVAQVLSWYTGAGGRGWMALKHYFGLEGVPEPAAPVAAVGWSLFAYSCAVEESPLKHLPRAFDMIAYKTGNPWLDLPQIGYMGFEWSGERVQHLATLWQHARELDEQITGLDRWLDEEPRERIGRAIELWNRAAEVERKSGYEDRYVAHGTFRPFPAIDDVLAEVYGENVPLRGDIAGQLAALTGRHLAEEVVALPAAELTEE